MSDWTLIYQTDVAGNVVKGSVSALAAAVRSAADVKLLVNTGPGIWWSRYCPSVSVRGSGNSKFVAAVFMVAADTEGAGELSFNEPFAIEYHIYNSNGVRHEVKVEQAGQNVLEQRTSRLPIRWYVKDYQLPWFDLPIGDLADKLFDETR